MPQKSELTGRPALMKELNMGLIKDALAKYQKATRVELSAITGISQPTVNLLIKQMMKEKVVISAGMAKSTGGRKAEVFSLNNKRFRILSVMVKESGYGYRVTDLDLKEEAAGCVPRDESITFLEQLCRIIREALSLHKYIGAIAVGVPGAVSDSGEVFAIPKIPEWERFPLRKVLAQEFSIQAAVLNDINAIASGYFYSHRDGTQNMVYLDAVEMGAGLIINGRLYGGFRSFAGEVGYLLPEADTGKIVVNMICILNPEKIVLNGGENGKRMLEEIRRECLRVLPEDVLPGFVVMESDQTYYFKGLGKAGKELLDQNIRLV